jgi:hypothetical protein
LRKARHQLVSFTFRPKRGMNSGQLSKPPHAPIEALKEAVVTLLVESNAPHAEVMLTTSFLHGKIPPSSSL